MSYLSPGGKRLASSSIVALMFFAVASAFEPGRWKMPMRDRGVAIEIGVGRVVLRGELDPRDVLHAHHRVGGLLDDDVAEFLGAR